MKAFFLITLSFLAFQPNALKAQEKAPIVLELFTSQSCSSCPPADRVLSEWAKQDNIIALSCNVTYWNYLHWEDTLSKEFCTQRQRDYNAEFRRNGVYTPQLVINGTDELVGSRSGQVKRAISKASNSVQNIQLTESEGILTINLPSLPNNKYNITLFSHSAEHTQSIPSGENRGRTVSYTNPVQNYIALGNWDGAAQKISYDTTKINSAAGYVVLVQEKNSVGAIKAAGQIKL